MFYDRVMPKLLFTVTFRTVQNYIIDRYDLWEKYGTTLANILKKTLWNLHL